MTPLLCCMCDNKGICARKTVSPIWKRGVEGTLGVRGVIGSAGLAPVVRPGILLFASVSNRRHGANDSSVSCATSV